MLKKKFFKPTCICACIVMLVVLVAIQFTPYWTFTDGDGQEQTISIGSYVWFPNEDVSNDFEDVVKDEVFPGERMSDNDVVNEIVMFPAITFGLAVLAIATCILGKKKLIVPGLATLIVGLVGIIGYISSPALNLSSAWTLHFIITIILALVGAAVFAFGIMEIVQQVKEDRALYSYH